MSKPDMCIATTAVDMVLPSGKIRRRRNAVASIVLLAWAALTFWNGATIVARYFAWLGQTGGDGEAGGLRNTQRDVDYAEPSQSFNTTTMVPPPVVNTATSGRHFPRTFYMDHDREVEEHPSTYKSTRIRNIDVEEHMVRSREYIEDDKNYAFLQDPSSEEECVPMSSWQTHSYPNCNMLHEMALDAKAIDKEFSYIASGGYNDIFRVQQPDQDLALKILSPGKKHRAGIPHQSLYSTPNFDVVRHDALIMEQLTKSSHILPIHGYCGFAIATPFADGGTFADKLASKDWRNASSSVRLNYAKEAAKGLADMHDLGVVHADLTIKQYLVNNNSLQLGDFNQGIILRKNATATDNSACTFILTANYGTTRAPEEYSHKPQTNAIDVWNLGSIIYHILTGKKVWGRSRYKKHEAQEAVVSGKLPEISKSILNSTDPVDKILKEALDMCYIYEPKKRRTAREVATLLEQGGSDLHLGD